MKTIQCFGSNPNLYHKFNRLSFDVTTEPIDAANKKLISTGTSVITGFHKGEINVGDIVVITPQGDLHIVDEIIERRDHAGIFPDPNDKIDSFFKVKTHFSTTKIVAAK